jgi:hypothetical protein
MEGIERRTGRGYQRQRDQADRARWVEAKPQQTGPAMAGLASDIIQSISFSSFVPHARRWGGHLRQSRICFHCRCQSSTDTAAQAWRLRCAMEPEIGWSRHFIIPLFRLPLSLSLYSFMASGVRRTADTC